MLNFGGKKNLVTDIRLWSCFSLLPFHHKSYYVDREKESNKSVVYITYIRNKTYSFDLHFPVYSKSIYSFKANSVVVEQQVLLIYSHLKR